MLLHCLRRTAANQKEKKKGILTHVWNNFTLTYRWCEIYESLTDAVVALLRDLHCRNETSFMKRSRKISTKVKDRRKCITHSKIPTGTPTVTSSEAQKQTHSVVLDCFLYRFRDSYQWLFLTCDLMRNLTETQILQLYHSPQLWRKSVSLLVFNIYGKASTYV